MINSIAFHNTSQSMSNHDSYFSSTSTFFCCGYFPAVFRNLSRADTSVLLWIHGVFPFHVKDVSISDKRIKASRFLTNESKRLSWNVFFCFPFLLLCESRYLHSPYITLNIIYWSNSLSPQHRTVSTACLFNEWVDCFFPTLEMCRREINKQIHLCRKIGKINKLNKFKYCKCAE